VVIQLIQTANILSHNLSKPEHKVYLLSSEFYSNIVSHPFDFSDEEIVENFSSLLKGLATNTSSDKLIFFVLENNFSLYARSLIFINYPDNLVKTAARTVILTLLKCKFYLVNDERINQYILESGFVFKIIGVLGAQISAIDEAIKAGNKDKKLEMRINECIDTLYYINDMIEEIDPIFTDNLCNTFFMVLGPVLVGSVYSDVHLSFHVSIHVAFYMLIQIFNVFKNSWIVDSFAKCLLCAEVPCLFIDICSEPPPLSPPSIIPFDNSVCVTNPIRNSIFAFLKCKDDNLVLLPLLLIQGIVMNQGISRATLLSMGLANSKQLHEVDAVSAQATREILEIILNIYDTYPLFRFTVYLTVSKIIFEIFTNLTVLPEYEQKTKNICCKNIERIQKLLESTEYNENILNFFDEEWEYVRKINFNSKIHVQNHNILPVLTEEVKVSDDHKKPTTDIELCRALTKIFFLMRKLIMLTDKFEEKDPNVYPFFYSSKMNNWTAGNCYSTQDIQFNRVYVAEENCEYSLKYLADDEDFFVVVTPDLYRVEYASVILTQKWRYISATINEANLQIKIKVAGKSPTELSLGFESPEAFYKEHERIVMRISCSRSLELSMVESFLLETLITFNKY